MAQSWTDDDQLQVELNIAIGNHNLNQEKNLRSIIAARENGRQNEKLENLLIDPNVNKRELEFTLDGIASDLERAAVAINAKCFETMEKLELSSTEKMSLGWLTSKQESELAAEANKIRSLGKERS